MSLLPDDHPVQARVRKALSALRPGLPIVAVVGPTATGKSDWGIALARRFGGEVISADSRQVYRGLDLGTGKVTGTWHPERGRRVEGLDGPRGLVPLESEDVAHWLLDVADPMEVFTAAEFQLLAYDAMADIAHRGRLPIIVGGTGLYVHAVVDGLVMPAVKPDPELRRDLEGMDVEALRERLLAADPRAGEVVDLKNPRRMVRALEVALGAGSVAGARGRLEVPFRALEIGVSRRRDEQVMLIRRRLRTRLEQGMLDEARHLLERGVTHERMEDLGLEYRAMSRHLRGLLTLEQMEDELARAIAKFARRQETWFRSHGHVISASSLEEGMRLVQAHLGPVPEP